MTPLPWPPPGALAAMHCPGRHGDLTADVAALRRWGANWLLSLCEPGEFPDAAALEARLARAHIGWVRFPIPDYGIPDPAWRVLAGQTLERLDAGERVAIHCWGGRGRSGTLAAALLLARGLSAPEAIAQVRRARPGAIETPEQEAWVLAQEGWRRPGSGHG
ncbi:protein-tyrosine phosphatase family protein [Roseomonas gilardii]|uniref:phosphatase domain-containing protein n=1 Tax=Roseomonas gilardii TaxID=257708 RepID=UPI00119F0323|nr:protein-tyrosine phosphatase family protein [Roseomonas gilardii]